MVPIFKFPLLVFPTCAYLRLRAWVCKHEQIEGTGQPMVATYNMFPFLVLTCLQWEKHPILKAILEAVNCE
jgi:hypothetical protein